MRDEAEVLLAVPFSTNPHPHLSSHFALHGLRTHYTAVSRFAAWDRLQP